MPKRFTSTEIWDEDWYIEMPNEYKLFWYYMLSSCDHAGFFKVNSRAFSGLIDNKIDNQLAFKLFNYKKDRVREISSSLWLIEDFFVYQYGHTFNPNNNVHKSILGLYRKHGVALGSIRGLTEVKDVLTPRAKDKDKEKDKDKDSNQNIVVRRIGEK